MDQIKLPHHHGQSFEQELTHMPPVDNFQIVADIFKQLGDGSRIRIFWILCHCEECVINLSAMVGMSSPAVSHHLKQLKAAELIVSRREGKEVYYEAARTQKAQLLHYMIEHLMEMECPTGHEEESTKESAESESGQEATIRDIHRLLTENPDKRFTIEELSRRYLINTSTLKAAFRQIYGSPIASYMKEYRVRLAMGLLRDTDDSIAEIAQKMGYETQGKFAEAFRQITHMLPSEYRKSVKNS